MRVWPSNRYPLGATWDGSGVNFALFSENATGVELCLFDRPQATGETARVPMKQQTHLVWHVYLPDVRPGQLYGYQGHGPYEPVGPYASISLITAHDGFFLMDLIRYN